MKGLRKMLNTQVIASSANWIDVNKVDTKRVNT